MKIHKRSFMSRMGALAAILMAMAVAVSIPTSVAAVEEARVDVPTIPVGSSAYFGDIIDVEEALGSDFEEALQELEQMGYTVDYDVTGNMGLYFGGEVVSDSVDIDGETCYDYEIMGGYGLDIEASGTIDGSMEVYQDMTIDIEGSGNVVAVVEVSITGHIYMTVEKLAIAKIDLTMTADADIDFDFDVDMSYNMYGGMDYEMSGDGTIDAEGVEISAVMAFDPPIDIYQFPIYENEEWYVPKVDTDVSGSVAAEGTVAYDISYIISYQDEMHESDSIDLEDEYGNEEFSDVIPGGAPHFDYDTYEYLGGTLLKCVAIDGDNVIIEIDMGDLMSGPLPFPGTRQTMLDPTSMMPGMGFQMNKETGMVTAMTVGGEAMTEEATQAEVEDFTEQPLEATNGEIDLGTGDEGDNGGDSPGSMMMVIVAVVVIVVVIVVVVAVVAMKKGGAPPAQPMPYDPNAVQQPPQPMQQQYQQPPQPMQQQYQQPPQGQNPPPQQGY